MHPTDAFDRTPPDAELLRRAVEGDGRAFAELFDRHSGAAYAAARRILGPTPAAEDAVQEAMLQLWRTGGSYRPERGPLRAWVLMLVRSRAIDLLRREQVRAAAAERAGHLLDEGAEAALDVHLRREHAREIQASVVALPPDQATVVGLQFYAGRTQAEIASHLDVPLGTVKGRTRLAFAKLRRELDGHSLAA